MNVCEMMRSWAIGGCIGNCQVVSGTAALAAALWIGLFLHKRGAACLAAINPSRGKPPQK